MEKNKNLGHMGVHMLLSLDGEPPNQLGKKKNSINKAGPS